MIRSKPNYELKAKVLRYFGDTLLYYRKASRNDYAKWAFENYGVMYYSFFRPYKVDGKVLSVRDLDEHYKDDKWLPKECKRINHADDERQSRLKKRISNMLHQGQCLFVTLTFTDDAFANTSKEFRRIAVRRYLKSQGVLDYVANIDYGKKHGREHYHAVALIQRPLILRAWKYAKKGAYVKYAGRKDADEKRLSKYVAKLTNHAIKETTKRSVYIYCRDRRALLILDKRHVVGLSDLANVLFLGLFFAYYSIKLTIVIRD